MPKPVPLPEDEAEVRSILMRLYHSRVQGETAYPARFVTEGNGAAPDLEAKGWIERRGDGWRMTEAGVMAWADMSKGVTTHGHCAWMNELYYHAGKPIRRIRLTRTAHRLLRAIAAAGVMTLDEIEDVARKKRGAKDGDGLATLMSAAYVLVEAGQVQLSVVGRVVAEEMGLL